MKPEEGKKDSRLVHIINMFIKSRTGMFDLSAQEDLAAVIEKEYVRKEDCPKYCKLHYSKSGSLVGAVPKIILNMEE